MLYEQRQAEDHAAIEADEDEPTCPRCGGPGLRNKFGGHEPCADCPDLAQTGVTIRIRADGAAEFRVPTGRDIEQATS